MADSKGGIYNMARTAAIHQVLAKCEAEVKALIPGRGDLNKQKLHEAFAKAEEQIVKLEADRPL